MPIESSKTSTATWRRWVHDHQLTVQHVYMQDGALATTTTILPVDDTIPQNTEGAEFMTLAITPRDTANILEIEVNFVASSSTAAWISVALFQDSTAGALAATTGYSSIITGGLAYSFKHTMLAGTTEATTFKVRGGQHNAGTCSFNGSAGTRRLGGVMASGITIKEYRP